MKRRSAPGKRSWLNKSEHCWMKMSLLEKISALLRTDVRHNIAISEYVRIVF